MPRAGTRRSIFPSTCCAGPAALGFAGIYVREDVGGSGARPARRGADLRGAGGRLPDHRGLHLDPQHGRLDDRPVRVGRRCGSAGCPRCRRWRRIASYCLTEPGSGSDAAALRPRAPCATATTTCSTARKAFISGGGRERRLSRHGAHRRGRGRAASPPSSSRRARPASPSAPRSGRWAGTPSPPRRSYFDDCRVPAANRLGAEGDGLPHRHGRARRRAHQHRRLLAGRRAGGARHADRLYGERKPFGQALNEFQALQFRLADMATELEAARA